MFVQVIHELDDGEVAGAACGGTVWWLRSGSLKFVNVLDSGTNCVVDGTLEATVYLRALLRQRSYSNVSQCCN